MPEQTVFSPDSESETGEKNNKLAALLTGSWNEYSILRVKRIEDGEASGWQATYEFGVRRRSRGPRR